MVLPEPTWAAVGDADGADLYWAPQDGDGSGFLLASLGDHFSRPVTRAPGPNNPRWMTTVDFDSDGRADFLWIDQLGTELHVGIANPD